MKPVMVSNEENHEQMFKVMTTDSVTLRENWLNLFMNIQPDHFGLLESEKNDDD